MLSHKIQLKISRHAEKRAMERGINAEQINLCIEYGDVFYKTGMTFFFMSKKCLMKLKNLYGTYLSAFEGIVVMARKTKDGLMIVTVYRNRNASKIIKKKQTYNKRSNQHAEHHC